ncbi:uncharacterized protein BJ212DRAFT_1477916 [Suillus subaureus]|uniref:SAM domain-containing protein n=1 Tax=Suillus subaureus TaxID=48587 RepID=A0A9P7EH43_9AGAM|nr:uncharacterized protein BJ212DRAFT_1477916 [Suillus subaureus]KAG1820820.1 hypothetical protein BJ212DRAFT_1477916 [Suillus subaureus]
MMNTTVSSSAPTAPMQSKKHSTILPNAHPYAIKTTSSAVLSRSNSSPHSSPSVKHHYVPPSPTRPRHRHTPSLSSVEGVSVNEIPRPSPLPVPPSFHSIPPTRASCSLSNDITPSRRLRRADTLPSSASLPALNDSAVTEDNELPRNPKHWSTDDFASHFATSFRAGNALSSEDQGHLLRVIKEQNITGRSFLRLTDADLASLSLTPGQRLHLLEASRALRADVLRGRIWVDSYHSKDMSAHSKGVYTRSTRSSNSPFNCDLYNFSTSSVDLILSPSASIRADGDLSPSPAVTLNRSNSVSDSSAQRYRDLARMRVRRRGQVKGLVDTWERERGAVSGSEGSMSGSDVDSDNDIPSAKSPLPPALSSSTISLINPPPPPYTSLKEIEDEPTIEELLTSSGPIKGARAWEVDYGLGETVKRIPTSTPANLPLASTPPRVAAAVEINADSNESSVECSLSKFSVIGNGRANTQKRIVTAIFTGGFDKMDSALDSIPVDDVPQANLNPGEVVNILDAAGLEVTAVESAEGASLVPGQVAVPSDDDNAIALLEASIVSTQAQLEAFRARLEVVETQIAAQEAVNNAYLRPEEAQLLLNEHQPIDHSCIHDPFPAPDDDFSGHRLSLRSFARSIVAHTLGWLYPYSHPGAHPRPEVKATHSQGLNASLARPRILPEFRLSYVIMFSFALCAAILRKVGNTMRRR